MLLPFRKAKVVLGLLPLVATLGGTPRGEPAQHVLRIRVSQETSPGAGDFDNNVLGFVEALQSNGLAADFYMYGKAGPNYGNSSPVLRVLTSHLFFVNAADGLALFVVHNTSNKAEQASEGTARTRFELSGGTATVLRSDDGPGEAYADPTGTIFTGRMAWAGANTDGMVIGALPIGFTILGQFTDPPWAPGLKGGWEVISSDGSTIPLQLVPGQRVRLDVRLGVDVQQGP